jgi:hypothetical protein
MTTEAHIEPAPKPSRVLALVATVPARRQSCTRVLAELARQTRPPDGIVLVLDGYGDEPAPPCPLPIVLERRAAQLSGAGNRWRVAAELPADDIVVNVDDDTMLFEAPQFIAKLVAAVEEFGAAGAMGRTFDGKGAPPGLWSRGELMHAAGPGLSMRAGTLANLAAFADAVKENGGPDALGPQGDDDSIVSAYLWKQGMPIKHAAICGKIFTVPGTVSTFKPQKDPDIQKRAIAKASGWPFRVWV